MHVHGLRPPWQQQVRTCHGVGGRTGATWLQAAIRTSGGSSPPAAVRYIDRKIAEHVGRRKKEMLASRTHIHVEESFGDEEQVERKWPKKDVVERKSKGKGKPATHAGGSLDTDALVDKLTDAVFHAGSDWSAEGQGPKGKTDCGRGG